MLHKPLITTAYSGHMDFCNEENSFLVDYKIVESQSHLGIRGAKVAEPDLDSLIKQMKFVYENVGSEIVNKKIEKAYEKALDLTWNNSAKKILNFVSEIKKIADLKNKKLAVISTYNSKCGIAVYSHDLYSKIFNSFLEVKIFANYDISDRVKNDKKYIDRTWQFGESNFERTITELKKFKPDQIQIQYNLSFYSLASLNNLLNYANDEKIPVYLTLHSFNNQFKEFFEILKKCTKVFVHSQNDYKEMLALDGGLRNVYLLEHGINNLRDEDRLSLRSKVDMTDFAPIIASHGLVHDKKGLLELIESIKILKQDYPNILLLLVNALNPNNQTSSAVFIKMQKLVTELKLEKNVRFINKFLAYSQIIKLLHLSDVIVLPYGNVKEGASGAVRTSIAASRPIIITNSYIFQSLDCGIKMPDNKPVTIAKYVKDILNDEGAYLEQKTILQNYTKKYSWDLIALKYLLELTS